MNELEQWLLSLRQGALIRIGLIAFFTFLALAISHRLIERFYKLAVSGIKDEEALKRGQTLSRVLKSIIYLLIILVGLMLILSELKIDIKPIIAAAGIGGVALGFGAQNLIKDLIAGFFLLLEDQIRIGDVVKIGETSGVVEDIKLRVLLLRDLSGNLHIIPHGNINSVSNLTHKFSYYVFNYGVGYKEDAERVLKVLEEVTEELRKDPEFQADILEPAELLGLDRFEDSAMIIMGRIKTKPMRQWRVGRELNLRVKKRFDQLGIEIPFPARNLYFGNLPKNLLELHIRAKEEGDDEKEC